MLAEEMKAIGKRIVEEAINSGNVELFNDFFSDDFLNHSPSLGTTPDRDGLKQMIQMMHGAFSNYNCTLLDLIAEKDKLVFLMRQAGKHTGELIGIAPTGKEFDVLSISIVRFENRKIVERWNLTDEMGVMRQLGPL